MGLGSGKILFRIPNPGVKKAPNPGSGSATLESGLETIRDGNDFCMANVSFTFSVFYVQSTNCYTD